MSDVAKTLAERDKRYGAFTGHARITQALKRVMRDSPNWERLSDDQKESLEMNAHKVGRILNGDPNYADSWHDIAGYSKLVDDRLVSEQSTCSIAHVEETRKDRRVPRYTAEMDEYLTTLPKPHRNGA